MEVTTMVTNYDAIVEREGKWWVFRIPELDTSGQARNLAEVETEARGIISAWNEVPLEDIAVNVTIKGAESLLDEWQAAAKDEAEARLAQARAADRRRAVVATLRSQKYTAPDVGRVLGISPQRVHQIEKPAKFAS
jgi:DNA-directed RNA polymerase specialized sigma subunit